MSDPAHSIQIDSAMVGKLDPGTGQLYTDLIPGLTPPIETVGIPMLSCGPFRLGDLFPGPAYYFNGIVRSPTEAFAVWIAARDCTLSKLIARSNEPVGATVGVSLRVNGVTTALAVAVTNEDGTAAVTDPTHTVAVVAGDLVCFQVVVLAGIEPAAVVVASCLVG